MNNPGSTTAAGLPSFRLDGRFAVVTGASQGIGRTLALAYSRAGAEVALVSRRPDKLAEIKEAIQTAGGKAYAMAADLSRVEEIRGLGAGVGKLIDGRDSALVLVNCAGFGFTKAALEISEQEWDRLLDLHVKGTFFCCQEIGRLMIARGYGKIINLSSTWSATTDAGKSVYGAAKAAVSYLTAALSTEWAPLGVRVNALAPTATLTESVQHTFAANPERAERLRSRIKLGRFAQPEDMVGAAIFLASEASDFVTGHTLFVDGGWHAGG